MIRSDGRRTSERSTNGCSSGLRSRTRGEGGFSEAAREAAFARTGRPVPSVKVTTGAFVTVDPSIETNSDGWNWSMPEEDRQRLHLLRNLPVEKRPRPREFELLVAQEAQELMQQQRHEPPPPA